MSFSRRWPVVLLLICSSTLCGCWSRGSIDHSADSNVSGILLRSGEFVPDVILTVYAAEKLHDKLALGITDEAGFFRLLAADGKQSVTLPAGEYVLVVDSLTGTLTLPREFSDPASSPLRAKVEGPWADWHLELPPVTKRG